MKTNRSITVTRSGNTLVVAVEGIAATRSIDVAALTADIRDYALFDRIRNKIVDAAALSRDPTTGRSADAKDKMAAMVAVIENLEAGEWTAGGAMVDIIATVKKIPVADARAFWEGLDKTQRAAVKRVPAIADEMARRAPRADAGIGEELLAKLG